MLRFYDENMEKPTRTDAALACSPILLFDLSAFFLVSGASYLHQQRLGPWGGTVLAWYLSALLLFCATLSVWIGWRLYHDSNAALAQLKRRN
jgi:hypothetical protein